VERHGRPVPGIGALGLTHLFPDAATLADADLTDVGLTRARARAVNALAVAVATGALELHRARDLDHTLAELEALPGFGPWTAHYVAMRVCGERDAFPASDLGLRRALGDEPSARAESWRPWRAYGAIQIWLGPVVRPD
jgi:AraC family transcriptional regulator, regulatory protein of adaptative response / DNA-3-methyladenine glycosylase II